MFYDYRQRALLVQRNQALVFTSQYGRQNDTMGSDVAELMNNLSFSYIKDITRECYINYTDHTYTGNGTPDIYSVQLPKTDNAWD